MMFIFFLALFSYIMLCDFYPIKHLNDKGNQIGKDLGWPEILLIFWVSIFTIDEINQVNKKVKFKKLFYILHILFIISFIKWKLN